MMPKVGGLGDEKSPDETVHKICEQIRDELESKLNRQFSQLTPVVYKTQLVNGVNYFIKAEVDNKEHIHIRAYKGFRSETAQLNDVREKLSASDPLEYF